MTINPCIELINGQDLACFRPFKNEHYQLALLYPDAVVGSNFKTGYNGNLYKSDEIESYTFQAPNESNIIKGTYKKTEDNFGYAEYEHSVTLLITAFTDLEKRQVHALNNKTFKVILFNKDRTAEIYGANFGLKTTDYNYNNESEIITLKSIRNETTMPLNTDGSLEDEWIQDAFQIFDKTFDRTFE